MISQLSKTTSLPIGAVIPEILDRLSAHASLVLQAPPGAGKTTLVPLCLLDQAWRGDGRIIMLEPRRLAARAAARRMAEMLGEDVGETVGYRVRLDHKVSARTRIEVVTEGVLLRLLQDDPELTGIAAVLFDEFHERSLEADFGLALCLDVQQGLREDLKLVVMSATLDGENVARLMGGAPIVTSEGRAYPVEMRYLDQAPSGRGRFTPRVENTVAEAVLRALKEEQGSLLVFLPGAGEIERCATLLRQAKLGPEVMITPLYGRMTAADQDLAIRPAPEGMRKVVLATAIAETSLTIDGIRVVIDGGLDRSPRYDVGSGMTRLETNPLSKASAEQRAGRAGRLSPGVCYRMWTEAAGRGLAPFAPPEITKADLVPLVLELANWGIRDPGDLNWLDVPDPAAVGRARDLLRELEALDDQDRITDQGRQMARLAMHPRLAHMVLKAKARGLGELAVRIAALLAERDILRQKTADLRLRLRALNFYLTGDKAQAFQMGGDRGLLPQIKQQVTRWRRALKLPANGACDPAQAGLCLALAYPDRIGGRRPGDEPRYVLSGGRGAMLEGGDDLGNEKYLAVCDLALSGQMKSQGSRGDRDVRIYMAAPLALADLEEVFADHIHGVEEVVWDDRTSSVLARRQVRLGRLILREEKIRDPDRTQAVAALCQGIRKLGLQCLPWDKASLAFRGQVTFCCRHDPAGDWPDFSDESLLATLEDWLGPYLAAADQTILRREQLSQLALADILQARLDWTTRQRLDEMVPSHFTVPSGSRIRLDYSNDPPILAARLQEMFGLLTTPAVMEGRVRLLVHLLSPAGRPLQVTQDLENFWVTSYAAVKKDMKGRYPKHDWPDDPLNATATRYRKRK
ncbi:ATP-dependent helicase HrpB [Paremcibacter congregatus]|uniref:ATP-dependent helicase HrpB n=1 Tax=Paremcibacter congregatus TaxID=2043170 RepID=UPI003A9089B6